MFQRFLMIAFALMLMSVCVLLASAQAPDSEKCRGPIYSRKEVTKPAKLIDDPNFKALYEAFGNGASGRVKLEAVLCRTGRVTDIRVIDSQPPKFGEFVAAAVSLVRFKPAELNWHTVSQRQQFEFSVNDNEISEIDAAAAAGRLVEELDIIGNRRMTKDQILSMMNTRPGDRFDDEQVQRDLRAILATGYFNSNGTRVLLDDGVRGGVRVIFEVFELPLIKIIEFEGLNVYDRFVVINELARRSVEIHKGDPLDPAQLKKATRVIEQFFQSQGWANVKAEAFVQNITATEVQVTFKISGRDF